MAASPFLHDEQEVTWLRLADGGDVRDEPLASGTLVAAVENVRETLRQQPGGQTVAMALRLWIADVETVIRPKDVFSVVWLGETQSLVVEDVQPFPTAQPPHQQILVVSRLGAATGLSSVTP